MTKRQRILKLSFLLSLIVIVVIGALALTEYVMLNAEAQTFVGQFGYVGILLVSFVAGLNLLVPIPAATFVPIFAAGGIPLPIIVALLVIGTMSANLLAYVAGYYGGKLTKTKYPELQKKLLGYYKEKREWLPYFVFSFSAVVPLPDEIYLVPLGIIGVRLRVFIVPLLFGTIIHQTMFALGMQNIFSFVLGF